MSTTTALHPSTIAALAKAISDEALASARGELPEDATVDVDATIRITGTVQVGKSCMATQTNKLCPWKLALAAINRLNGASIAALVREAAGLDDATAKPFKAKVAEAAGALLGTVKQMRAAPVSFIGTVEEV
jgi:hypothetical protein